MTSVGTRMPTVDDAGADAGVGATVQWASAGDDAGAGAGAEGSAVFDTGAGLHFAISSFSSFASKASNVDESSSMLASDKRPDQAELTSHRMDLLLIIDSSSSSLHRGYTCRTIACTSFCSVLKREAKPRGIFKIAPNMRKWDISTLKADLC